MRNHSDCCDWELFLIVFFIKWAVERKKSLGLSRLLGSIIPVLILGNSDMFSELAASCWSLVPFVYLSHGSRLPLPVQSLPAVQQHWRAGENRDSDLSTSYHFILRFYFVVFVSETCWFCWTMLVLLVRLLYSEYWSHSFSVTFGTLSLCGYRCPNPQDFM